MKTLAMMRGKELIDLSEVPAGVICAVELDTIVPGMSTFSERQWNDGRGLYW